MLSLDIINGSSRRLKIKILEFPLVSLALLSFVKLGGIFLIFFWKGM